jgi:hypothetical protein
MLSLFLFGMAVFIVPVASWRTRKLCSGLIMSSDNYMSRK